jgi:polysaccharide biosynthesis/export protein
VTRVSKSGKRFGFGAFAGAVSILCATVLLSVPMAARAQERPAAPPTTPTGNTGSENKGPAITSPTYKIVTDDVLTISVQDRGELNRQIQVLTDGTIDFPDVGIINVVGMTISDLKKKITTALAKKYTRPNVTIAVAPRVRQISIFGPVGSKGKVPLRDGWRVKDVLASVGGLAGTYPSDRYEFYRAQLERTRTGEVLPIDLVKLLGENDPSQNYVVEPDDVLKVSELDAAETTVTVLGQVAGKQGPQLLPRNGNVVDVLLAAGGPTPLALLSKVIIERNDALKNTLTVDLRDYKRTGFQPPVKLQAGDRIIVPENRRYYYLYGQFGAPGEKVYPDDEVLTVSKAIARAGGLTQNAELKKTTLIRELPSGKTQTYIVNVEEMLKKGDLSKDMEMLPGDRLYIKPPPQRRWDFNTVIGTLGTLLGLVFVYNQIR